MARRTKAQIALEKRIDAACNKACIDKSINILNLNKIAKAAEQAAANGEDVEAAAEKMAASLDEKTVLVMNYKGQEHIIE